LPVPPAPPQLSAIRSAHPSGTARSPAHARHPYQTRCCADPLNAPPRSTARPPPGSSSASPRSWRPSARGSSA
jgi:hypothetical protein